MNSIVKISMSIVLQMLQYLSSQGISETQLLKAADIDPSLFESPDSRISIQQFYRIQEKTLQWTGDRNFGLHLGEFTEAGSWSTLGYIVMNCRTLKAAIERFSRYHEVVGNFIQIRFTVQDRGAVLVFDITMPEEKHIRHCYEAAVSSVVHMMRAITGEKIRPSRVTMKHRAPADTGEHERILGCPVLFGQKATTMVFDNHYLDTPIAMHNPGLLELLEQHAQRFIHKNQAGNSHTERVTRLIVQRLADGPPTIEKTAKELSMSVRSLQMRLSEEGMTFRQLLQNTRKELAMSYLEEKECSIDEITWLLGFSEPSVFRKTFKKWTGLTPSQYRKCANQRCPNIDGQERRTAFFNCTASDQKKCPHPR